MKDGWNPWHGCHKISPGCAHCYVYRMDARHEKDSAVVTKNADFDLPLRHRRDGTYRLPAGSVIPTCFTSDFFLEDADPWRPDAWRIIRERQDAHFFIITKRIHRLPECLPPDWGDGYENVTIYCTVENQDRADFRLPLYAAAPIRHKGLILEPLLESIDLTPYLGGNWLTEVSVGGESGNEARPCHYDWVLSIRQQCMDAGVAFAFRQTGARFVKDGKLYRIPRRLQHAQARKANLDYIP